MRTKFNVSKHLASQESSFSATEDMNVTENTLDFRAEERNRCMLFKLDISNSSNKINCHKNE